MGALIMTRGTKRLAAHYNDEFDTWLQFYRKQANLDYFDRTKLPAAKKGNIDIWSDLILTISDKTAGHSARANDKLTLLPPDHPKHPNLSKRWQLFLQNELSQTNQNLLVDHILTALQGPYVYIIFDVVPAASGGQQDVTLTFGSDDGQPIATINIVVTRAMP
jgi:hypothetical protein